VHASLAEIATEMAEKIDQEHASVQQQVTEMASKNSVHLWTVSKK